MPDLGSVGSLDPGSIQGVSDLGMREEGKHSQPNPTPPGSGQEAGQQEQGSHGGSCSRVTSTHSGHSASETDQLQSESIIINYLNHIVKTIPVTHNPIC